MEKLTRFKVVILFLCITCGMWDFFSWNIGSIHIKCFYLLAIPFFVLTRERFPSDKLGGLIRNPIAISLTILLCCNLAFSSDKRQTLVWILWFAFNAYFAYLCFENYRGFPAKRFRNVFFAALCANLLVGVSQYVLIKFWGMSLFHAQFIDANTPRINGLSYWPNFYSISLVLSWAPYVEIEKSRMRVFLVSLLYFLASLLTTAKTGQVGSLVLICLISYLKREKILPLCVALVLSIALFYACPLASRANLTQYQQIVRISTLKPTGGSIQERFAIGHQGLKVFSEHPLIGVGLRCYENFTVALSHESKKRLKSPYGDSFYHRHENIWIELLAEFGVGTLLIFAFLLFFLLKNIRIFLAPTLFVHYFVMGMFVQNINLTLPILLFGLFCAMRWRAAAPEESARGKA